MAALRDVVLARCSGRVVIFVDEIGLVQSLPFSTSEFFAAIRYCRNRRAEEPVFNRLAFCLVGVATPSDLIRDTHLTQFNVGRRIDLTDFTAAEAQPLRIGMVVGEGEAPGRSEPEALTLLQRVLYWTGGHPYLTQRLCLAVARDASVTTPTGVDRLCAALFLSSSARQRDENLMFVSDRLLNSGDARVGLLELYRHVRSGRRVPVDDTNPLVGLLRLSGIVRVEQPLISFTRALTAPVNHLTALPAHFRVRNRIYEQVFDPAWIDENMPDAELRRQQAAYRRGVRRTAARAGVVLTAMSGLLLATVHATLVAREQARELRRERYVAQMNLAFEALKTHQFERLRYLLDAQRPRAGEEELRGFEWGYLWRRAHADRLTLTAPGLGMGTLQFLPGGDTFVTSPEPFVVQQWQAVTGRLLASFRQPSEPQMQAHLDRASFTDLFSPDGMTLATVMNMQPSPTAPRDGPRWEVRLWDWSRERRHETVFHGRGQRIYPISFSPDGRLLAAGAQGDGVGGAVSTIRLWDRVTHRERTLPWPAGSTTVSLAISPDDRLLAIGDSRGAIHLWDLDLQRENTLLQGSRKRIACLAFSPDGGTLAAGCLTAGLPDFGPGALRLWDLAARRATDLIANGSAVLSLGFSADGRVLAGSAADGTVRLWDRRTLREVNRLEGHTGPVLSLAFSRDGRTLATLGMDKTVRLWGVGMPPPPDVVDSHSADGGVYGLAFSPDGRLLVTIGANGTIRLWDPATAREIAQRAGIPSLGSYGSVALDGRTVALSYGSVIRTWDVTTRRETVLRSNGRPITSLAFRPGAQTLAAATDDGTLAFWNLVTRRERNWAHDTCVARMMTFSRNGELLAALDPDSSIMRVWKVSTMTEVGRLQARIVRSPVLSPDGTFMALAEDHDLLLWRIGTHPAAPSPAHDRRINAVAIAPDGQTVATFSSDSCVKLWDAARGQDLGRLDAPHSEFLAAAFSPDGRTLAAGDDTGTLHFWRAATLAEADRRRLRR
jgi:WD40 repeat protein